jgi:hypothetical protein
VFVELAEEANNDKNNEFLNLNILQKNFSSVRPVFGRDKSFSSNFSLNMNTVNEHMQRSAFVRRESSIHSSPHFEGAVLPNGFKAYNEPKQEEAEEMEVVESQVQEIIDVEIKPDEWVEAQEKLFQNPTYNWNREVEGLLESDDENLKTPQLKDKKQRASKPSAVPKVNIRRHRKKSKMQLETLNSHFVLDEEWSLELVERLAEDLVLEKDQVYKWNWDKRKRIRKRMDKEGKVPKNNKRQKVE